MHYHLNLLQWAAAFFSAFLLGVSKTGFSGAGILAVTLFTRILPARASTGVVLPLLVTGDVYAVSSFRRHAVWSHVLRMLPWSMAGVIIGYFAMSHLSDVGTKRLIAVTILVITTIQIARKFRASRIRSQVDDAAAKPAPLWYVASMGLLAGFTTMTANAAGPIMILYLVAIGLPKMEFVGTGAWYFLIVNVFKIPFSAAQGLINPGSLLLDLKLIPVVVAGAVLGRLLLKVIDQNLFEALALGFAILGAIRLLF